VAAPVANNAGKVPAPKTTMSAAPWKALPDAKDHTNAVVPDASLLQMRETEVNADGAVYFLVVLAIAITGLIAWAFVWSVRTGQFDDLDGPAHRILHDDPPEPPRADESISS